MPFYHALGQIPHKRHTQFKKPDGKLYREELMGLEGFSSIQSILYHHFLPPRVTKTEDMGSLKPDFVDFGPIRHRAFRTVEAPLGGIPFRLASLCLGITMSRWLWRVPLAAWNISIATLKPMRPGGSMKAAAR